MKRIQATRSANTTPQQSASRQFSSTGGGPITFIHLTRYSVSEEGPVDFSGGEPLRTGGDAATYFALTANGLLVKQTGLYWISFWGQMTCDQTFLYTSGYQAQALLQLVAVKGGITQYLDAAGGTLIAGGASWSGPWTVEAGTTLQIHMYNDTVANGIGFSLQPLGTSSVPALDPADLLEIAGGVVAQNYVYSRMVYPLGGTNYVSNGRGIIGDPNSPTWDPDYPEWSDYPDWWWPWSDNEQLAFLESGIYKFTMTLDFDPPPGGPWHYMVYGYLQSFVPYPIADRWQDNWVNYEYTNADGKTVWESYWKADKYESLEFGFGFGDRSGGYAARTELGRGGRNRIRVEKVDDVPLSHPNTWDLTVDPSVTWLYEETSRYTLPQDATLERVTLHEDLVLGRPSYPHIAQAYGTWYGGAPDDDWPDVNPGYDHQLLSVCVDSDVIRPNIINPTMLFDGIWHDQSNTREVYVKRDLAAGTQMWVEQAGYGHANWEDPTVSMTFHFSSDASASNGSISWPRHDLPTRDFVATGTATDDWQAKVAKFGPFPDTWLRVWSWEVSAAQGVTVYLMNYCTDPHGGSHDTRYRILTDASLPVWQQTQLYMYDNSPYLVGPGCYFEISCTAAVGSIPITVTVHTREHTAGAGYPFSYADTHKTFETPVW